MIKKFCVTSLFTLLAASFAQADLVWERDKGWYVEGGVLGELNLFEGSENALESMNRARDFQEDGAYYRALANYEDVFENYAGSIYAPEALFQSAKIRADRNQFEDAIILLSTIVSNYPNYENFNGVLALQFSVATRLMEGERPYYWGIIPGLRDERLAMDYYEGIVRNAPYSDYAPVALMNVALIAQDQGLTEESIDALDRLVTNYPQSMLAPDAYLNLAKTFASLVDGPAYDQASTKEAITYFSDFLVVFPQSESVADAEAGLNKMMDTLARSKFIIGEFYWKNRNNPKAAKIFLNETITIAPQSAAAAEAQELLNNINAGAQPPGTPVDWLFGKTASGSEDS